MFSYFRYQREEEDREREALLSRKFAPNDPDTSIMIDAALQQNNQLQNAHRGMNELLTSGSNIITSLRDQRSTLKGAHKKILDVMNTLGLSNTVMRLIERRTYQDKFILYGGMIVTCLCMWFIWRYFSWFPFPMLECLFNSSNDRVIYLVSRPIERTKIVQMSCVYTAKIIIDVPDIERRKAEMYFCLWCQRKK